MALRDHVREQHDRTEAVFAAFSADPLARMDWFLSSHMSVLCAVSHALQRLDGSDIIAAFGRIQTALHADCTERGLTPVLLSHSFKGDPLAAAYVILGSRLGVQILRRRVIDAGGGDYPAFFDEHQTAPAWRSLCIALDAIDPQSDRAEDIAEGAADIFDMFTAAAAANR